MLVVKGDDLLHDSREKLSSMVERFNMRGLNVIAAINADFFAPDGDIKNNQISKGEFVKGITTKRSQFALTYFGEPFISVFKFSGFAKTMNDSIINIDAVNHKCGNDSSVLLNHYWNYEIELSDSILMFVLKPIDSIKQNETAKALVTSMTSDIKEVTGNSYILAAKGNEAARLKRLLNESDTISIYTGFDQSNFNIEELAGGFTQIVKDGIDISESQSLVEGTGEKFRDTRHPRSAIGYNKDRTKIFLVTVDGRQKISAGMSLKELAEFMIHIGCYDALNFDGGGSTTMIVNNKIVNSPSDLLGERSIGNALLLITK